MITITRGEALAIAGAVLGFAGAYAFDSGIATIGGIVLFWFGVITSDR